MATLFVHTLPTLNSATQKIVNVFLKNIPGHGSPWPKLGQHLSPNQSVQSEAGSALICQAGATSTLGVKGQIN